MIKNVRILVKMTKKFFRCTRDDRRSNYGIPYQELASQQASLLSLYLMATHRYGFFERTMQIHIKYIASLFGCLMDRLHYGQNFEKSRSRKIYYHSIQEHPKISKIAKFGCET